MRARPDIQPSPPKNRLSTRRAAGDIFFLPVAAGMILLIGLPVLIYAFSGSALHANDDMFQEYLSHGMFRESILKYRRFPFWQPYIGGGYPLYAHPHDASLILPAAVPILLFGEVQGLKINIFCLYLFGMVGMFLYCRKIYASDRYAVLLSTAVYGLSPFFLATLKSGNYNELFLFLFPAILYFYDQGKGRPLCLLIAGWLMAQLIWFGKFPALGVFLLILVLTAAESLRLKKRPLFNLRPLRYCAVFALLTAGLSLAKTLPLWELLKNSDYSLTADNLRQMKYLAGFQAFLLALIAGRLYQGAVRLLGRYFPRAAETALQVCFLAAPLFLADSSLGHRPNIPFMPAPLLRRVNDFYQVQGRDMPRDNLRTPRSLGYFNFRRGIGTIDWYSDRIDLATNVQPRFFISPDPAAVPSGPLQMPERDLLAANPAYRGEAYLVEGRGEVGGFRFEPNRIVIRGNLQGGALVVVNQNYDPAWAVSAGAVKNFRGLIAVRLSEAETKDVVLSYRPRFFYLGLLGSLTSLAGFVYLAGRRQKFKKIFADRGERTGRQQFPASSAARPQQKILLFFLAAAILTYWTVHHLSKNQTGVLYLAIACHLESDPGDCGYRGLCQGLPAMMHTLEKMERRTGKKIPTTFFVNPPAAKSICFQPVYEDFIRGGHEIGLHSQGGTDNAGLSHQDLGGQDNEDRILSDLQQLRELGFSDLRAYAAGNFNYQASTTRVLENAGLEISCSALPEEYQENGYDYRRLHHARPYHPCYADSSLPGEATLVEVPVSGWFQDLEHPDTRMIERIRSRLAEVRKTGGVDIFQIVWHPWELVDGEGTDNREYLKNVEEFLAWAAEQEGVEFAGISRAVAAWKESGSRRKKVRKKTGKGGKEI